MALIIKISKGVKHLYFQAGPKSTYIAPKDNHSRAKLENVIRALEYTQDRIDHYAKSFDELLQFLPPKECKRYVRQNP